MRLRHHGLQRLALAVPIVALVLGITPATQPAQALSTPQSTIVSPNPNDKTPHVMDGKVNALAQIGSTIYAAGLFTTVKEAGSSKPNLARSNIFAFDASTGKISTTFLPSIDGEVNAILPAADGRSLYIGGAFLTVNGSPSRSLTRLNVSDGAPTAGFVVPTFNSTVLDMRLRGDQLIIGGSFTHVSGVQRPALVSLNAATGSLTNYIDAGFASTRPGNITVLKMDMTPDQRTMIVIGDFTSIGTETRAQVAKLNLDTNPVSLSDWSTTFYSATCSSAFQTYMRDLDISPDGTYFVLSTTGAFGGSTSPCDSQARFETGASGPNNVATWVSHTGGDTTYAVAITGSAVYIGGHFRWLNNSFASNRAGAGAVPREGIAALDPRNGIPLSWNPTRTRGVGVFDMLANEQGLWIGSDTDTVYKETHRKVAFFPLAGGVVPPAEKLGTLPNDVYLVGSPANTLSTVRRQFFDGTATAPTNPVTLQGPEAWGSARGAMLIDDDLYTAWSNGTFTARTFDGTAFGTSGTVNLYAGSFGTDASKVTGMFFDKADGRMYYTLTGSNSLYWRGFSPESTIVGTLRFTATGDVAAMQPNRVAGMFLDGNRLYFADSSSTGRLYSVGFNRGVVTGPVQLVNSSIDWRARGAFVWNGTPAQGTTNVDPTAAIATPTCTGLACTFDGSPSSDPDGQIASFAWDFGDGSTGTGKTTPHTYTTDGMYTATLTVTDNRGGTNTTSTDVSVANAAPTAVIAAPTCTGLACTFVGSASSDPDGSIASFAWSFGDGTTGTGQTTPHTYGATGTYTVALTVTDNKGSTNTAQVPVAVVADAPVSKVAFRASAAFNGGVAPTGTVTVPSSVQAGDAMLLFMTTNLDTAPSTTPAGWTLLGERVVSGQMRTQLYSRVAVGADANTTVSVTMPTGLNPKMDLTLLAYSGTDTSSPVLGWAGAQETSTVAQHVSPSLAVTASTAWMMSFWVDKSTSTPASSGWTVPNGQTQRSAKVGTGGGLLSSLAVDSAGPVATGSWPGLTATSSVSSNKATMWSVALKSK